MTTKERIEQLRDELKKGNEALVELARRQQILREQTLRIAGAVQVLEEMEREESNGLKSVQ